MNWWGSGTLSGCNHDGWGFDSDSGEYNIFILALVIKLSTVLTFATYQAISRKLKKQIKMSVHRFFVFLLIYLNSLWTLLELLKKQYNDTFLVIERQY